MVLGGRYIELSVGIRRFDIMEAAIIKNISCTAVLYLTIPSLSVGLFSIFQSLGTNANKNAKAIQII